MIELLPYLGLVLLFLLYCLELLYIILCTSCFGVSNDVEAVTFVKLCEKQTEYDV